MDFDLLNLIPNELLNLIWNNVKPSVKYSINKYYLNKFYKTRFAYLNDKKFIYNKYFTNVNNFYINNYNYIKYLIKNDCIIFIKLIINNNIENSKQKNIFEKKIYYENKNFTNIIDFSLFFCKKFKSIKIYDYINDIIKKYNLTKLQKKWHKNNNNKLNKWTI